MSSDHEIQFQRWIRDHLGLMIKVVRSYAVLPADQEDLLQDVLVNLWSSIANFRGSAKETTWIYRVSLQTAMVWRRGERRRHKHQTMFFNDATASVKVEVDGSSNGHELIEKLYAAIRQLPKLDASIAIMHLDGLSYQEIAEVLGISENYVGVKLTRIRKQLSDQFGKS